MKAIACGPLAAATVTLAALSTCSPTSTPQRRNGVTSEVAMFRGGPTHVGVYADHGPEVDPSVLWRFATDGPVLSSPAVIDGRAYFGSDDGFLYAVDINTGAEAWRFRTGGAVRSSPAVADVVVHGGEVVVDEGVGVD